jgi:hypothetical protein
MPGTETALVRDILRLLALHGIPAWRQNTGGMANPAGRYVAFGNPGAPDISGIIPDFGRALYIEVKRPGNRPTAEQWAFLLHAQRAGAFAFWTDSVEYVIRAIPYMKQGHWIETDHDYAQHFSDLRWTARDLQPPASAAKPRRKNATQRRR